MIIIRESLWESSVWLVGHVLSPAGYISIRVVATLSVMSGSLSTISYYVFCIWIRGWWIRGC
jgi:hypothetical protein